ncbi:MAG: Sir2 family NAD-dependent protein deacetylase, partial [Paracoccaceae bacterium]|nr:Sir2 family NAD-dependent protein deacetylase [Paracoccaceae bacterium]
MTKIVILTGAGISAESGLGTFRAEDGLWAEHRVEDVATPEGFHKDPALVHRFYNMRRAESAGASPNAAHKALARLEAQLDGSVAVVTQNVDDLHERGGSQNILHMHGSLAGSLCAACDHRWPSPYETVPHDSCPS